jgi:hypothetical protein
VLFSRSRKEAGTVRRLFQGRGERQRRAIEGAIQAEARTLFQSLRRLFYSTSIYVFAVNDVSYSTSIRGRTTNFGTYHWVGRDRALMDGQLGFENCKHVIDPLLLLPRPLPPHRFPFSLDLALLPIRKRGEGDGPYAFGANAVKAWGGFIKSKHRV